jgi:hypothetical protein
VTLNILLSYAADSKRDLANLLAQAGPDTRIFMDSGAFAAFTVGKPIKVADYTAWLKDWMPTAGITTYANLDVIRDARGTLRNQRYMERHGLRPLPVFHGGEDFKYLDAYCAEYDYIALGGLVGSSESQYMPFTRAAFRRQLEHGTQFHGFGMMNIKLLKSFPWFSVDSSNWVSGERYGTCIVWDDGKGDFHQFHVRDHAAVFRLSRLIREHGVDPHMLVSREKFRYEEASYLNVAAWARAEAWLHRYRPEPPIIVYHVLSGHPDRRVVRVRDTAAARRLA